LAIADCLKQYPRLLGSGQPLVAHTVTDYVTFEPHRVSTVTSADNAPMKRFARWRDITRVAIRDAT
jgi:hypothetical protein